MLYVGNPIDQFGQTQDKERAVKREDIESTPNLSLQPEEIVSLIDGTKLLINSVMTSEEYEQREQDESYEDSMDTLMNEYAEGLITQEEFNSRMEAIANSL